VKAPIPGAVRIYRSLRAPAGTDPAEALRPYLLRHGWRIVGDIEVQDQGGGLYFLSTWAVPPDREEGPR
jgi:hypothetical protein